MKEIWAIGPLMFLGLLLVGCFSTIHIWMYFSLRRNGHRNSGFFLGIADQIEYMKVRKQHGWPAWPIYVMWLCLIAGVILMGAWVIRQPVTSSK